MKIQKYVIFVKKNLERNFWKMKSIVKLQIIAIIQKKYRNTPQNICNLKYSIPNKYPIVFHNGSNYDHQYIIKELAEKFKKQLTCLGENI